MRAAGLIPVLSVLLALCSAAGDVAAGDKGGKKTRDYEIAQTYPYPPWDVGPLQGVSIDVMLAICEANRPMKCRFKAMPSEQCFDSDSDGNPIVGRALASGKFDGCLTWFRTPAREQLGAEFGNPYSRGSTPQLIASNTNTDFNVLGDIGSLGGANVAFFAGFFSDAACLSSHYSDFNVEISASDDAARENLVKALLAGDVDLVFWDNLSTAPAGTHLVGVPVASCGPDELGLAVYPPSKGKKDKADALRRDYNCGLALIRLNGELEEICSSSPYPGGDPACRLDGPLPTVQCLEENRHGK